MLELMAKKTPKINKNVTTITMSTSATELSNVIEIMLKTSVGKISTIDQLKAIFSIGFIAFLRIKCGTCDCIKPQKTTQVAKKLPTKKIVRRC